MRPADLQAQRKSDIGFLTGTSYYMGDINPAQHYYLPSFAIGPIFRYNFDQRHSLRAHAVYHTLAGNDADFPNQIRPQGLQDFQASFVDLALQFEFNWWPYKTAHRKSKYSPYVFAGLGYAYKLSGSPAAQAHVNIPFGLGVKANLGKKLSGGIELGTRKTFSDRVDGVVNPGETDQFAPFGNRDWYMITGVFITYKIFRFREDCPTYDDNNTKRKRR